jgi:hypothetical protein
MARSYRAIQRTSAFGIVGKRGNQQALSMSVPVKHPRNPNIFGIPEKWPVPVSTVLLFCRPTSTT